MRGRGVVCAREVAQSSRAGAGALGNEGATSACETADCAARGSMSLMVIGVSASRTRLGPRLGDRKSTRLNSSHSQISYAVFCLKKKKKIYIRRVFRNHQRSHVVAQCRC